MTITAPGPRRIDYGAVSIRVRGDCNHEWTARTTKAAAIQQGPASQGGAASASTAPTVGLQSGG